MIKRNKENKFETSVSSLEQILQTNPSKLAGLNVAIKVHSEISDYELWICSNEKMIREVRRRNLKAKTYTINEIEKAITSAPDSLILKQLQEKFGNSTHKKNEGVNS